MIEIPRDTASFAESAAPADVVRRQYLASARGDLAALRSTLADDVEWTEMAASRWPAPTAPRRASPPM